MSTTGPRDKRDPADAQRVEGEGTEGTDARRVDGEGTDGDVSPRVEGDGGDSANDRTAEHLRRDESPRRPILR
jgi:hypothetical protein